MPGQLKPDAACPVCDTPIEALVDETANMGTRVVRIFYHKKGYDGPHAISPKARRRRRCMVGYSDPAEAARIRKGLEV